MFGTLSFILPFIFAIKLGVMFESGILVSSDLWGVIIATPFLIGSNILVRKGFLKLSKSTTDKITILAMSIFSIYALVIIIKSFV